MSTDVDTLSIRVHLASVREQQIRREADVEVARAALNDAIGLPLDTPHTLTSQLVPLDAPEEPLADRENAAIAQRPEARQAKLATSLAETQAASARSSLLPQVTLHGAYEADRQRFITRGGDNWLVSIGLRWNLFNGFSDKARIEESKFALKRSLAEEARTSSAIRLQVHRAYADLHAATQQIEVAKAAVAEAEESLAHHPEPVSSRNQQRHRFAAHGDHRAGSSNPPFGRRPGPAHRRRSARTRRRHALG